MSKFKILFFILLFFFFIAAVMAADVQHDGYIESEGRFGQTLFTVIDSEKDVKINDYTTFNNIKPETQGRTARIKTDKSGNIIEAYFTTAHILVVVLS